LGNRERAGLLQSVLCPSAPFLLNLNAELRLGEIFVSVYFAAGIIIGIAFLFVGSSFLFGGTGHFGGGGTTVSWPIL
jgi:hypothetical protein